MSQPDQPDLSGYGPTKGDNVALPMDDIDFTNGVTLTPEEMLACSLENPEYCEACQ